MKFAAIASRDHPLKAGFVQGYVMSLRGGRLDAQERLPLDCRDCDASGPKGWTILAPSLESAEERGSPTDADDKE